MKLLNSTIKDLEKMKLPIAGFSGRELMRYWRSQNIC